VEWGYISTFVNKQNQTKPKQQQQKTQPTNQPTNQPKKKTQNNNNKPKTQSFSLPREYEALVD
jgi:hypothetical protein